MASSMTNLVMLVVLSISLHGGISYGAKYNESSGCRYYCAYGNNVYCCDNGTLTSKYPQLGDGYPKLPTKSPTTTDSYNFELDPEPTMSIEFLPTEMTDSKLMFDKKTNYLEKKMLYQSKQKPYGNYNNNNDDGIHKRMRRSAEPDPARRPIYGKKFIKNRRKINKPKRRKFKQNTYLSGTTIPYLNHDSNTPFPLSGSVYTKILLDHLSSFPVIPSHPSHAQQRFYPEVENDSKYSDLVDQYKEINEVNSNNQPHLKIKNTSIIKTNTTNPELQQYSIELDPETSKILYSELTELLARDPNSETAANLNNTIINFIDRQDHNRIPLIGNPFGHPSQMNIIRTRQMPSSVLPRVNHGLQDLMMQSSANTPHIINNNANIPFGLRPFRNSPLRHSRPRSANRRPIFMGVGNRPLRNWPNPSGRRPQIFRPRPPFLPHNPLRAENGFPLLRNGPPLKMIRAPLHTGHNPSMIRPAPYLPRPVNHVPHHPLNIQNNQFLKGHIDNQILSHSGNVVHTPIDVHSVVGTSDDHISHTFINNNVDSSSISNEHINLHVDNDISQHFPSHTVSDVSHNQNHLNNGQILPHNPKEFSAILKKETIIENEGTVDRFKKDVSKLSDLETPKSHQSVRISSKEKFRFFGPTDNDRFSKEISRNIKQHIPQDFHVAKPIKPEIHNLHFDRTPKHTIAFHDNAHHDTSSHFSNIHQKQSEENNFFMQDQGRITFPRNKFPSTVINLDNEPFQHLKSENIFSNHPQPTEVHDFRSSFKEETYEKQFSNFNNQNPSNQPLKELYRGDFPINAKPESFRLHRYYPEEPSYPHHLRFNPLVEHDEHINLQTYENREQRGKQTTEDSLPNFFDNIHINDKHHTTPLDSDIEPFHLIEYVKPSTFSEQLSALEKICPCINILKTDDPNQNCKCPAVNDVVVAFRKHKTSPYEVVTYSDFLEELFKVDELSKSQLYEDIPSSYKNGEIRQLRQISQSFNGQLSGYSSNDWVPMEVFPSPVLSSTPIVNEPVEDLFLISVPKDRNNFELQRNVRETTGDYYAIDDKTLEPMKYSIKKFVKNVQQYL